MPLAVAVATSALGIHRLGGFEALDERLLDRASAVASPDRSRSPVAVVDIDDATVEALGYPFSRAHHARLLDALFRGGARLVVFDIVFDTRRDLFPGEDAALEAALSRHRGRVVLAGQIRPREQDRGGARVRVLERGEADETIAPLPELAASAPRWGAVDVGGGLDGLVRRYRLAWPEGGRLRLSLASAALVQAGLVDSARLMADPVLGDPKGFRVRFGPVRSFPVHSFLAASDDSTWRSPSERDWDESLDLADSLAASGAFRGRIVVVGSSAKLNHDVLETPLDPALPGAELHALALATVLEGSALRDAPSWAIGALLVLSALASLVLAERLRAWWAIPLPGAVLTALWAGGAWWAASRGGLAVPPWTGFLGGAGQVLSALALRWWQEASRKREITRTFGQYLSPEVVRLLVEDPSRVRLGGRREEITVLFSDFQGFTGLSETLEPEVLVPLLGECFTALSQQILDCGGTLDKYMGDAVMAEFGMPLPLPDKALRACRAAWRMQRELARLRGEWSEAGLPLLRMRVGLGTGMALVGNMGGRQKFDYTALGDTVNLASRLEGVNKRHGTEILLDGPTRAQAGEGIEARLLERVRVVGRREPVELWQLLRVVSEPEPAWVPPEAIVLWDRSRETAEAGDFAAARAGFAAFLELVPGDRPASVWLERLATAEIASWDPVATLDAK